MKPELQASLHVTLIYKPELHERMPGIVQHVEDIAKKYGIIPEVTSQFHTNPRTEWNKKATHDYYENSQESVIANVLFVEADLRKLDDAEWAETVSAYDKMLNGFKQDFKKYIFYLK